MSLRTQGSVYWEFDIIYSILLMYFLKNLFASSFFLRQHCWTEKSKNMT